MCGGLLDNQRTVTLNEVLAILYIYVWDDQVLYHRFSVKSCLNENFNIQQTDTKKQSFYFDDRIYQKKNIKRCDKLIKIHNINL